jgi:hypothetical protein
MKDILIIRRAIESDAEQIIQHTKKVLEENPNVMGTTSVEFNITIDEEKDWINSHNKHGLLLVV